MIEQWWEAPDGRVIFDQGIVATTNPMFLSLRPSGQSEERGIGRSGTKWQIAEGIRRPLLQEFAKETAM